MKNLKNCLAVVSASVALALTTLTALTAHAQVITPPTTSTLAAQVNALAEQVKQLSAASARQQQLIASLSASNAGLVAKLGCVASTSGTRDFIFDGCNVHVQNGAGSTKTTNSYGNLIIGYNKNEVATRTGSHNVILGDLHEYKSFGGIVSGDSNTLAGSGSVILGSVESSANTIGGVVLGANKGITDVNAVVVGGTRGYAGVNARFGVVVGGNENQITAGNAVIVGGTLNIASGGNSLVCGGSENQASGGGSVACGGSGNQSQGLTSTVSGGLHNIAASRTSVVTGGQNCSSGAVDYKWSVGAQASPGGCTANTN